MVALRGAANLIFRNNHLQRGTTTNVAEFAMAARSEAPSSRGVGFTSQVKPHPVSNKWTGITLRVKAQSHLISWNAT
jgi:hypothetical protein